MRVKQLVVIGFIFFISACAGTQQFAPNFKEISKTHKTIAILPVKVENLLNIPRTYTEQDEETHAKLEGLAFSRALYQTLQEDLNTKAKTEITIQPLETTAKLLKNNKQLPLDNVGAFYCKLLNVDVVLITRVAKYKLYTEFNSLGVQLTDELLEKLKADSTDLNKSLPQIPGNAERTYNIIPFYDIVDANNKIMWEFSNNIETKWSANEVATIKRIAEQLAKEFPYRVKKTNTSN
jgi:hypothetical protein